MSNELVKVIGGTPVRARESDHYVNATELAQAAGKKWADYARLKGAEEFLGALAAVVGIPITGLVQVCRAGSRPSRGLGSIPAS